MSTMDMEVNDIDVKDMQEEATRQYLSFAAGGDEFGIEIRHVWDIVTLPKQSFTPVPWLPDYIKGIINLRGTIVPVVDVCRRFNKPQDEYHERTCVIVVTVDSAEVGMIVDSVKEVLTIPVASLAKPPQMRAGVENRYVQAIASPRGAQEVVLLLDIKKLFYDEASLSEAAI